MTVGLVILRVTAFPAPSVKNECIDSACSGTMPLTSTSVPFNDPPLYGYDTCNPASPNYSGVAAAAGFDCSNSYPFYKDPATLATGCSQGFIFFAFICTEDIESSSGIVPKSLGGLVDQLNFYDSPGDPALKNGDAIQFQTRLVGILGEFFSSSDTTDCLIVAPPTCVDTGIGFDWSDSYTGPSGTGGISLATVLPVDDSGTGGITITALLNGTSPVIIGEVPEPSSFIIMVPGLLLLSVVGIYRRNG
jgi:hypothetical protein